MNTRSLGQEGQSQGDGLSRNRKDRRNSILPLVHWNVNTATFVASATVSRARSDGAAIPLRIARRSDKAIGPSRRHPQGRWGLWTISALVVVEDGQASSSSSCLDLASQAPSANVAVFPVYLASAEASDPPVCLCSRVLSWMHVETTMLDSFLSNGRQIMHPPWLNEVGNRSVEHSLSEMLKSTRSGPSRI